jgi:CubicO group peptidase (beta-lactamase class C family)
MRRSTPLYALKLLLRNTILCLLWITLDSAHFIPVAAAQANSEPSVQVVERIQRVENGLAPVSLGENEPPLQLSLEQLMGLYKVPGLSLAVIDNYKIAWAKGYGVTEAGAATPVTTHTLFMAGSIAKTPTAAAALALVEQGKLSLDENVNQRLKTWKVPENEFTTQQKVTLRRILSHSAGLTVHGFPGYATDERLPTLLQVLNGENPANTAPVRVDFVPGTKWRYSGGGVLIEQQLMMDVTGKQFPQLMREMVFDRIGMNESTYEEPLPPARGAQAASGTYASGKTVPGKWHVYREMAAGGLWTTPTDLANFAIEIALSKQGKSNRILTEVMTREMLKTQMDRVGEVALGNSQHVDRMGLGFFLGDESRPDLFGHIGDDEGFQAMLYMFGDSGQGAVIMANSENGILLGDLLLSIIANEYGWKNFVSSNRPQIGSSAVLLSVAQQKGVEAAIQAYWQLKKMKSPQYGLNRETLIGLGYSLLAGDNLQDAIEIMKLEVHEYPDYWNAYDSMGELYMNSGEKKLAIKNYEKSVELNPDNQSGIEALKKLKAHS